MAVQNAVVEMRTSTLPQRFEAKYRVNAVQAEALKAAMAPFVSPDPHAEQGASYPVTSLYLDSPDLALFRSSAAGEKDRIKLRVRTYSARPEALVFLETKRRFDQIISKARVKVPRALVPKILSGGCLSHEQCASPDMTSRFELGRFRDLMTRLHASPCAGVRYMREAYVGGENGLRITFDTELACLPCAGYSEAMWTGDYRWERLAGQNTILEIKFTERSPAWVQDLIQRFHLVRESVSKYVICVLALKRRGYPLPVVERED